MWPNYCPVLHDPASRALGSDFRARVPLNAGTDGEVAASLESNKARPRRAKQEAHQDTLQTPYFLSVLLNDVTVNAENISESKSNSLISSSVLLYCLERKNTLKSSQVLM